MSIDWSFLKRFRFTILALVIILVMLLIARFGGGGEQTADTAEASPSPTAIAAELPEAALIPGGAEASAND